MATVVAAATAALASSSIGFDDRGGSISCQWPLLVLRVYKFPSPKQIEMADSISLAFGRSSYKLNPFL
jgi:hypothetical protein